jgi:hypothetical protein
MFCAAAKKEVKSKIQMYKNEIKTEEENVSEFVNNCGVGFSEQCTKNEKEETLE